ncbi:hypothetical protein LB579_33840 [Mesorhizobium sp. BR1-1-7]|uniref:hypothetical protein n=1 Tax=Mesorhizobium sp. BR1-1-7 TaxID=2876647 RepID=UPI001CCB60A6|nr:hypothetical protein [Mesorhizobium sp. BR1-1-7]MBZ9922641.1 hypothetical protein [Mesorhizobium sp. BR1-1-7]
MTPDTEIPDDIREKAQGVVFAICADTSMTLMGDVENMVDPIAEALMQERAAQRDRAAKMLSGIADVLAKKMTDLATPELLNAIAAAVKDSDAPSKPPTP